MLAILNGELDGTLQVEHPYYVKANPTNGTVAMMPYCVLSNESYFEFKTANVEFVVTAAPDITQKFLNMINVAQQVVHSKQEEEYDAFAEALSYKNFLDGNNTKH